MSRINDFKKKIVDGARSKTDGKNDVIVKIEKDDIKTGLNKSRLRNETIEKVKTEFKKSGIEVLEDCTSTVCIKIPADKLNQNVFTYKEVIE